VADRVGKGFREAPRDAMIAAVTPGAQRASAFSVHRAMDHAGTILGGGLAVLLIRELGWTPAQVFGWSVVPGICVVVAVLVAVRSGHAEPPRPVQAPPPARVAYGRLAPLLAVLALSRLGLASEMFLLLFAGRFVPLWGVPLLWAGLHAVKSAASAGAATLGRRLQPPQLAAAGWASHAMVFFGFAFAALRWDAVFSGSAAALSGAAARTTAVPEGAALAIVGLFAAWGLHAGLSEGAEKALVAGRAASEAQGTAFGAYHLVAGLAALPASLGFGWMWDTLGAAPAFALSGGCAGLAAVVLTISGVGRA
jgi:hypothetical protein